MIEAVAVVGPTASGKTSLAIALAELLDTEIVSADSMQFYRGMEIGTGAPTADDLARVKHHFIGVCDPSEKMSAGSYQDQARDVVRSLNERGKIAVIVGGSGLYLRALLDGLFGGPAANTEIRENLTQQAEAEGLPQLHARLSEIDPEYAKRIEPTDPVRITRALEVYEITGRRFSELHDELDVDALESRQFAIDWPRDVLYERIERRVDEMMELGLLSEVRRLVDEGHEDDLERLKSIGYREMLQHLRGESTLDEAVERMKIQTRRFAKRQLTWFRPDDRIEWLDPLPDASPVTLAKNICTLLSL